MKLVPSMLKGQVQKARKRKYTQSSIRAQPNWKPAPAIRRRLKSAVFDLHYDSQAKNDLWSLHECCPRNISQDYFESSLKVLPNHNSCGRASQRIFQIWYLVPSRFKFLWIFFQKKSHNNLCSDSITTAYSQKTATKNVTLTSTK